MPWGFFAALASPHRSLSTGMWLLCGSLLSFLTLELAILILFLVGNGTRTTKNSVPLKKVFERKPFSFGTVSVLFGAFLPTVVVSQYGVPVNPWSLLVTSAALMAFLIVAVVEYTSRLLVTVHDDGIVIDTFCERQTFLFSEIVHGVVKGQYAPFIVLQSGNSIYLDGYLSLRRIDKSLGDTLFTPFLHSALSGSSINGDRYLLMRYLSFCGCHSEKSHGDVTFFLDALGTKSPLASLNTFIKFVPALFLPLFYLLNLCNNLQNSLWSNATFSLVLLCLACLSIYVARGHLIAERLRMKFVRENVEDWLGKSLGFIRKGSSLALVTFVALYMLRERLITWGMNFHYGGYISVLLPVITLLVITFILLPSERKIVRALVEGSPEVAIKLMNGHVTKNLSMVFSAQRAYALAVSGQNLDLALVLARRGMCRLITSDTMLYSSMAAARVYQLKGNMAGAVSIARKMLLSFPEIAKAEGIRGRIYFEAKTIIESIKQEQQEF